MAKTKKFKSNVVGVIYVPGHSSYAVKADEAIETDDPAAIAAFEANPNLTEVKDSPKRKS